MMVYSSVQQAESTRRSLLETSANLRQSQILLPPSILIQSAQQQQQQQHQQFYSPYNSMSTCLSNSGTQQPAQYIYPQKNHCSNSLSLHASDSCHNVKDIKWNTSRSRPIKLKEFLSTPNLQQPTSYSHHHPHHQPHPHPPLLLFDSNHNHLPIQSPTPFNPIYLNQQSSCYNHHPNYPADSYSSNFNTSSYCKPLDNTPSNYYLMSDRQSPTNQYLLQHQQQSYSISPGNLQNIKSTFPINHSNISINSSRVYSDSGNNISTLFTGNNFDLNPLTRDRLTSSSSTTTLNDGKCKLNNKYFSQSSDHRLPYTERLFDFNQDSLNKNYYNLTKNDCDKNNIKNRIGDDESNNFDFNIEAEKMVSALCNTSTYSNDLDKDNDDNNKLCIKKLTQDNTMKDLSKINQQVNDNGNYLKNINSNNNNKSYKHWSLEELCSGMRIPSNSVATQTLDTPQDDSQYPELIRKTIYSGCNEAEKILKNQQKQQINSIKNNLFDLCSATKIALTKSSTCFPIFSGDKVFSQDLINSLIRIANGWLILDNYLNKQHNPRLSDKYDSELLKSFKNWEVLTYELLKNVVKTFIKLELESNNNSNNNNKNDKSDDNDNGDNENDGKDGDDEDDDDDDDNDNDINPVNNNNTNSSFPGDISLYINNNSSLFGESLQNKYSKSFISNSNNSSSNISYKLVENRSQLKHHRPSSKDCKSKTKWGFNETTKLSTSRTSLCRENNSSWSLFSKEFPTVKQLSSTTQLNNDLISNDKLPYNFFLPTCDDNNSMHIFQLNQYDNQPPTFIQKCSTMNSTNPLIPLSSSTSITAGASPSPPPPAQSIYHNFTYNNSALKNRITLLSQVESKRTEVQNTNDSTGDAINLSALFASMRDKRLTNCESKSLLSTPSNWLKTSSSSSSTGTNSLSTSKESSRYSLDKMDINRQLRTLKNMRLIQSAPWTANHFLEDRETSENLKVYMKPGSYNVPKKKYQSSSNRRAHNQDISLLKKQVSKSAQTSFDNSCCSISSNSSNSTSTNTINDSSSGAASNPIILARRNVASSSSPTSSSLTCSSQDVTWKAACASAELLLDALNLKNKKTSDKIVTLKISEKVKNDNKDIINNDDNKLIINNNKKQKLMKKNDGDKFFFKLDKSIINRVDVDDDDDDGGKMEVDDNDDKSCKLISLNGNTFPRDKTDSWLIRTLTNATSQIDQDNVDDNSNKLIDKKDTVDDNESINDNGKHSYSLETSHTISVMTLVDVVGKATYSETVRRFSSNKPPSSSSSSKALNKNSDDKKVTDDSSSGSSKTLAETNDNNNNQHRNNKKEIHSNHKNKKKDNNSKIKNNKKNKNQNNDRNWSVWYSSKKKNQNNSLGPIALGKLVSISTTLNQDSNKRNQSPTSSNNPPSNLSTN